MSYSLTCVISAGSIGRSRSPRWRRRGTSGDPHSANLSLVTVFTLHLMARCQRRPNVEFSIEGADYYPGRKGCFRRPSKSRMERCGFRTGRMGRRGQSGLDRQRAYARARAAEAAGSA